MPGLVQGSGWAQHHAWPTCGVGTGTAHRASRKLLGPWLCAGFPGGSEGKASACNMGDLGSIPGLGRSPTEGNGYPLQYSCLEMPRTEETGRLQSLESQRVTHD